MERTWKRGDVGPDGRRFWQYYREDREMWLSEDAYRKKAAKTSEYARRYREQNAATRKAYRALPHVREKERASWKRWAANNGDHLAAKYKKRYFQDPEKTKAYVMEWRRRNPEAFKRYQAISIARRRAVPRGLIMDRVRARIKRSELLVPCRDSMTDGVQFLSWCLTRFGMDVERDNLWIDHLVPIKEYVDGSRAERPPEEANAPENLQWLTKGANLKKGSRMPTDEEIRVHLGIVHEWRKSFSC